MAKSCLQDPLPPQLGSSTLLPHRISRAKVLYSNNLQIPVLNAAPLVSPLPSWIKMETCILTNFLPTSGSSPSNQNVLQTTIRQCRRLKSATTSKNNSVDVPQAFI
ncbi:hypothetical protein FHG87_011196 [Trinorchestia longiramus]|nr:hypothetical protein FHG87_011196 [Trinorchestia longiramus]